MNKTETLELLADTENFISAEDKALWKLYQSIAAGEHKATFVALCFHTVYLAGRKAASEETAKDAALSIRSADMLQELAKSLLDN
jgi:hypothetical protein